MRYLPIFGLILEGLLKLTWQILKTFLEITDVNYIIRFVLSPMFKITIPTAVEMNFSLSDSEEI